MPACECFLKPRQKKRAGGKPGAGAAHHWRCDPVAPPQAPRTSDAITAAAANRGGGARGSPYNRRVRVAWFSPMPPVRSGIALDSANLVAALGTRHQIDVFVHECAPTPAHLSAHEFIPRHRQSPYDLMVYQIGNSSHHDYLWAYAFRYPGLVVLHDAHLHHARAAALLRSRREHDYRAEFAAAHPDAQPDAAELAVAGFDSHLYYMWPMT